MLRHGLSERCGRAAGAPLEGRREPEAVEQQQEAHFQGDVPEDAAPLRRLLDREAHAPVRGERPLRLAAQEAVDEESLRGA